MVIGLGFILLFFIWLFHGRRYSDYNPSEYDTEMDLQPSKKFWETMARFDRLDSAFLGVLSLIIALVFIYNDVASYFGWPQLF